MSVMIWNKDCKWPETRLFGINLWIVWISGWACHCQWVIVTDNVTCSADNDSLCHFMKMMKLIFVHQLFVTSQFYLSDQIEFRKFNFSNPKPPKIAFQNFMQIISFAPKSSSFASNRVFSQNFISKFGETSKKLVTSLYTLLAMHSSNGRRLPNRPF